MKKLGYSKKEVVEAKKKKTEYMMNKHQVHKVSLFEDLKKIKEN